MYSTIELFVKDTIAPDDLEITADHKKVDFSVINNVISIASIKAGFHLLRVKLNVDKEITFEDVAIDGSSLRRLVHLSYIETESGALVQPATHIKNSQQTWILPFACPLSHWIDTVSRQLPREKFGQNLFDDYCFYYPDSIELSNPKFPTVIKDFFEQNYNATIIRKNQTDPTAIPYLRYQKEISPELLTAASREAEDNLDYIVAHGLKNAQRQENIAEYGDSLARKEWRVLWLHEQHAKTVFADLFPAMINLIDSLDIDCYASFIGLLPPNGFIYPHTDTNYLDWDEYQHRKGCTQLYISLGWPKDCYIKFAGAGTLNLESGQPYVINNGYFTHAAVNNSDVPRFVLSVRADHSILNHCKF